MPTIFVNWDNAGHTRVIPSKFAALLALTLKDDEQVIWFEQPDARRWRRSAYSAALFGLAILALLGHAAPWTRGGWYWMVGVLSVPGLILVVLPWQMHALARSTLYLITSQRALLLTTDKRAMRTYPVQQLREMIMRQRQDGSGDLILEIEDFDDSDGHPQTREHGFEGIRDVGLVQQILENLRDGKEPDQVRRHAALWRIA